MLLVLNHQGHASPELVRRQIAVDVVNRRIIGAKKFMAIAV